MHVQTKGILLGGLILALFSFQMVSVQQENRWANEFRNGVEKASLLLGTRVEAIRQSLMVCQALFHSNRNVTREEFKTLTRPVLQSLSFVQAIQWMPRVRARDRADFESAAALAGLAGFRIRPGRGNAEPDPELEGEAYFPVFLIEPLSGNERSLGEDPAGDPIHRAVLHAARDVGHARILHGSPGAPDLTNRSLIQVFLPVYSGGAVPVKVQDRRDRLTGFIAVVFDLKDLIHSVLSPFLLEGSSLAIVEEGANGRNRVLYGKTGPDAILKIHETTRFFDQKWQLVWQGGAESVLGEYGALPFEVGVGVFLAFVFLAFMFESNLERMQVQALIQTSVDGIITIDTRSVIHGFNPAAEKMFGYREDEVIGKEVTMLMPQELSQDHEKGLSRYLRTGEKRIIGNLVEITGRKKDGREFPIELGISELKTMGRHLFTAMIRDISAHKKLEKELEALSHTDSLTGVNNRRFFDQQMEVEWKRSTRDTKPLSLVILDIDNFKIYNDTYGHVQGDECLKAVARALNNSLHRAGDFIARYGGEEFVVLLPGIDQEHAFLLAETMRRAVELLSIENRGSTISQFVTISVGLATIENTQGKNTNQLLTAADTALYMAKQKGKNRTETARL